MVGGYAQPLEPLIPEKKLNDFAAAWMGSCGKGFEVTAGDAGKSSTTNGLPNTLGDAANLLRTGEHGAGDNRSEELPGHRDQRSGFNESNLSWQVGRRRALDDTGCNRS